MSRPLDHPGRPSETAPRSWLHLPPAQQAESIRTGVRIALLVAVPLLLGAAAAGKPALIIPLSLVVVISVWVEVRRDLAWWDLLVVVLAGVYILDYGFANVGLPGRIPIPLVDLIAVLLALHVATRPGFRWPWSPPFVFAAAFAVVVLARLAVDFQQFGALALRDATLGIELVFLVIGYWAIWEYGLPRISRLLSVVFLIGVLYMTMYPFREVIADASPMVGLQRPVPLVGNFVGGIVAISAFFFFALVRPFGRRSYVAAALALAVITLLQSRGLYLAIPTVICFVWLLARARAGVAVRRGLAATLLIGAIAVSVVFLLAPSGRVGNVSPSFVVAQLGTLAGREGPGASVDQRTEWVSKVMSAVDEKPAGWLYGVGLGPDLAFGFENEQSVLVRKPHNDYLETYARLGLLGLVPFVLMLATAFVLVVRAARKVGGLAGRFLWFAVAQTAVLAIIAATQPLLAFPYGTVPMFFVLGAALAVAERPNVRWAD